MLGKLIKHDFKSLSRLLLPVQTVILGATIIATAMFSFNIKSGQSSILTGTGLDILRIISIFMAVLMLMAIIAASVLVAFIIFYRFYKSFMSDEGYLTFTLPVKPSELLWSKLICAVLWILISSVVIFISLNIFILFGTSGTSFVNLAFYKGAAVFISETCHMYGSGLVLPIIEFILMVFVSMVYTILHVYLALIIGGAVARKHKLAAGIGFYFVINIIVGILSSILQFAMMPRMAASLSTMEGQLEGGQVLTALISQMQPYVLLSLGMSLVLSVVFFIASNYLIKNKLNLD